MMRESGAAEKPLRLDGVAPKPGRTLTVCQVDAFVLRDGAEHHCAMLQQTLMTMAGRTDGPKG